MFGGHPPVINGHRGHEGVGAGDGGEGASQLVQGGCTTEIAGLRDRELPVAAWQFVRRKKLIAGSFFSAVTSSHRHRPQLFVRLSVRLPL